MNKIKLMPHNEEAYRKVKKQFESSNKACVVHATGTGKSFIIAATAEDYDKVLVLAPNNYVLSELGKSVSNNCTLMTYQSLSQIENMKNMNFDLIVLDEFHRTGAEVWGARVNELIAANPNAKILGTTATEIRTEGRNMADEMFDGNVVSRLTLPMAWSQGILKVPVYITGLYTFDNVDNDMRSKIMKSNKTKEKKAISLAELDSIKLDWINSRGTDKIIKKYINPNSRRIIVFCDKIKYVTKMKAEVKYWLENAGLSIYKIYAVNSKNKNSEKHMIDFEKDNFTGVKVMMAVNMLNEGIHVSNVDTIIMLRPTTSKIIYMQQMGRCMSISEDTSPTIFDLVDNLSSASHLKILSDELTELENNKCRKKQNLHERIEFNIIDNLTRTSELINKLNYEYGYGYHLKSFDENLNDLRKFLTENDRLPYPGNGGIEARLNGFIYNNKDNPKIKSLVDKYKGLKHYDFDEDVDNLIKYCEKYNRLPISSGRTREESRLYHFRLKYKNNAKVIEIVDKFSRRTGPEENLSRLKEFVKIHNRLPNTKCKIKGEVALVNFIKLYKHLPEVMRIHKKYSRKGRSFDENFEELNEFIKKYSRLPFSKYGKDEGRLRGFIDRYKSNPEVIEIVEKYRRK